MEAATLRHNTGDLARSIEINQRRFGYSDDIKRCLILTALQMNWTTPEKVAAAAVWIDKDTPH